MISVIIPCYNSESFLKRAIESVFAQTYTDWEIILVNNNSKDNTQLIINEYVEQFPEKIFGLFESRKGACYARNLGLSFAKGSWIQFLDSDDELIPGKFERQLSISENKADIIIGAFVRVEVGEEKRTINKVYPEKSIWYSILYSRAGITSSNLYRKEPVSAINGWNTELSSSQEYDLMFRLIKSNATIAFDTEVAALIYEEPNSISRPINPKGLEKIFDNYIDLRVRATEYLNLINGWDHQLHKIYSIRVYGMLMGRKNASRSLVELKAKELALKVPLYFKIFMTLKYYVKKIVFNDYYPLLRR